MDWKLWVYLQGDFSDFTFEFNLFPLLLRYFECSFLQLDTLETGERKLLCIRIDTGVLLTTSLSLSLIGDAELRLKVSSNPVVC